MNRSRLLRIALGLALGLGLSGAALAVTQTPAQPVPGALASGLAAPALRMVLSLGAVLAVVAGLAWLARRLKGGPLKTGLIEIQSGVSLGAREKVVLLRVGQEQVLVGISAAGMRTLHVMREAGTTPPFASYLEPKS
jgi:flagellar protein FliO/FliZ